MGAGFYKNENGVLIYAEVEVFAPNYHIEVLNHNKYIYPIYDWYYFEDRQSALDFFNINENTQQEFSDSMM